MTYPYSIAYVETGRAPTVGVSAVSVEVDGVVMDVTGPPRGQALRAYVWAAWWTQEPRGKPWRSPDALGLVPHDGPGCGAYGIDYEAEEKAEVAADEAIRAALRPFRLSADAMATSRIHESFARAAYREHLGKPVRYVASRPGATWHAKPTGHNRPPTQPAREWWAAWHVAAKERAARMTGLSRLEGESAEAFTARFVAFINGHAGHCWQGSSGVSPTHPVLVTLGLVPGFTEADVRMAYRRLALVLHPDRGGSDAAFDAITKARDAAMGMVKT